jgi:hypothetical protein
VQRHLIENLGLRIVDRKKAEEDKGNIMLKPFVRYDKLNNRQIATYRVFVRDFSKTAYAKFPQFIRAPSPDLSSTMKTELRNLTKNNEIRVLLRRVGKDGREYEITHIYKSDDENDKASKKTKTN